MMGFASIALGPLGLIEALIVLGLVLVRVRRFPERTGAYLMGASIVPLVLLIALMLRMPSCDVGRSARGECYAPVTGPATVVYGIAGLAGAGLVGWALRRSLPRA
jgi:hypothetical protein